VARVSAGPILGFPILGLKDQCTVFFGGGEISIAPGGSMTFWGLARLAKNGLSAVKSTENISRMKRKIRKACSI
jgi:hypothetical protein